MKPLHLRREASKAIVKTLVTFSLGGLFGLWLASLLSSKALNSRISRLSKEIDFAESTEKQDSDQHWENAIWKRGPTGDGQSKGVGSAPDKIHTEQSVPKASGDTKIVNSDPNTLRKDAFSPSTQGSKQLRATDETSTAGMAVSHHESDNSKELTSQERQQQIQSTTASNSNPSQPSIEEKTLEQAQSAKVSADSQEGTTQTSMTKASAEVGNGLPAEQKQESLPLPPHAKPATPSTLNPLKSPHPVASLLRSWDNNGPMPRALVIALRNLAVEDLVSQIMKAHSEELQKYTVVDVGANNGFPVTRFALMRTVGRIISVDPDERNLKTLEKIYCPKDTTYTIFRGAAGRTPGKQTMMFSNTLDTSACKFILVILSTFGTSKTFCFKLKHLANTSNVSNKNSFQILYWNHRRFCYQQKLP